MFISNQLLPSSPPSPSHLPLHLHYSSSSSSSSSASSSCPPQSSSSSSSSSSFSSSPAARLHPSSSSSYSFNPPLPLPVPHQIISSSSGSSSFVSLLLSLLTWPGGMREALIMLGVIWVLGVQTVKILYDISRFWSLCCQVKECHRRRRAAFLLVINGHEFQDICRLLPLQ